MAATNFIPIPESITCPITGLLMRETVMTLNGQSYDKFAIEHWLKEHSTDPKTNTVLTNKTLIPNYALRNSVEEFLTHVSPEQHKSIQEDWEQFDVTHFKKPMVEAPKSPCLVRPTEAPRVDSAATLPGDLHSRPKADHAPLLAMSAAAESRMKSSGSAVDAMVVQPPSGPSKSAPLGRSDFFPAPTEYDLVKTILVIGDSDTGKRSMIKNYLGDEQLPEQMILQNKKININGTKIRINVCYYHSNYGRFRDPCRDPIDKIVGMKIDLVLFVADITDKSSYSSTFDECLTLVRRFALYYDSITKILVLNKCDLDARIIPEATIKADCQKYGFANYIFTSAKTGLNITKAFEGEIRKPFEPKQETAPVVKKHASEGCILL